jgi:hypothetical protein
MLTANEVEEIKDIRHRGAPSFVECIGKHRILADCRQLSSGTIAALIGKADYATIDLVQGDFVRFVAAMIPKNRWENWVQAWESFADYAHIGKAEGGTA